ncbi:putative cathepsin L [Helianthus debilis subsp. tardiflorus]
MDSRVRPTSLFTRLLFSHHVLQVLSMLQCLVQFSSGFNSLIFSTTKNPSFISEQTFLPLHSRVISTCLWGTFNQFKCDPEEPESCDSGCNGGLMNSAFEYTLKAGGLMREEDYPYTGTDDGSCKFDKNKVVASVCNFSVVTLDED